MKNEKNKIIFHIILKILLIGLIIIVNYLLSEHTNNFDIPELSLVSIIGGADGPTTIYLAMLFGWKLTLWYSLLIVLIVNIIILIIFDIILIIRARKFNIKFKLKIIFAITLLIILLTTILIIFQLLDISGIISILLNIILVIILFIDKVIKKIIKQGDN
ncbi:hypothetical protein FACS189485_22790 [Spirochaetia bacterium]|nr:hypothetical protein FACS189485_22790 [Spirochaetia bacterium]